MLPASASSLFPYTTLFRSAISLIERLTARRPRQLRIAVIDRFEVGAGATWRTDQTPHFLNNTYAAHTTIYPDESTPDRKSTRLNSSHVAISYAVFCLKNKI